MILKIDPELLRNSSEQIIRFTTFYEKKITHKIHTIGVHIRKTFIDSTFKNILEMYGNMSVFKFESDNKSEFKLKNIDYTDLIVPYKELTDFMIYKNLDPCFWEQDFSYFYK